MWCLQVKISPTISLFITIKWLFSRGFYLHELCKTISGYINLILRPCSLKPRWHMYIQAYAIHTWHFHHHSSTPPIVELVMALLVIPWHSRQMQPSYTRCKQNSRKSWTESYHWRSSLQTSEKALFICSRSVTSRCWRRQNIRSGATVPEVKSIALRKADTPVNVNILTKFGRFS